MDFFKVFSKYEQDINSTIIYDKINDDNIFSSLFQNKTFYFGILVSQDIDLFDFIVSNYNFLYRSMPKYNLIYANLKENIKSNIINLNCNLKPANGTYIDKNLYSNLYLNCETLDIQLSLFYKRSDYYWIGQDENNIGNYKWFGDFNRGINKYVFIRNLITNNLISRTK